MNHADAGSRTLVYVVFILVAVAGVAGRIAATSRVYEPELTRDETNPRDIRSKWPAKRPRPMPTFSSNDRSRWATVRSLVDEGTFVIGTRDKARIVPSAVAMLAAADPIQGAALAEAGYYQRIGNDRGIIFEDGWQSVDKILKPATQEFYSTKPPLLSVMMAGLYWLLQFLTGWTLSNDPFAVVRTLLVIVNLVPFALYLLLLSRLVERWGGSDWGRYFVMAAGCFATLVTPFLITFNNHTVATCCVLFALVPVLGALRLPWDRPGAASPPAPWAYALSGLMAGFVVCNELPALAFAALLFVLLAWATPKQALLYFAPAALVPIVALLATNYIALGEIDPAYSKFGGEWYEYEGSHWRKPPPGQVKRGIDWAWMHESRATYAVHVLIGHHGLFSLSPIVLLAVVGMGAALTRAHPTDSHSSASSERPAHRAIAGMTLLLTVVVVGFYLFKSDNYGGWTAGLRWLMWLTPLWLLTMLPVADWLGERRWGRWLSGVLLAWSIFSVSYPAWNPWRHPWIYNLLESGGYIPY